MATSNCAKVDKYDLVKFLGQGFHAKVKLGVDRETKNQYAVKIFKRTHTLAQQKSALEQEVEIMKKINHPNLVNLIEYKDATYTKKNGQSYGCLIIVTEMAFGGELFEFLSTTGKFDEQTSRFFFLNLIAGLDHMHQAGIAHRDIKPENILFDGNFNLKIADFGFSKQCYNQPCRTVLGTESYMIPEIHKQQAYLGTQGDLFGSAVILFIMISGTPPFTNSRDSDPYYKLLRTNRHSTFWKAHMRNKPQNFYFNQDFITLFTAMTNTDPNQRLTINEVKQSQWCKGPTPDINQLKLEFAQRKVKVDQKLKNQRLQAGHNN